MRHANSLNLADNTDLRVFPNTLLRNTLIHSISSGCPEDCQYNSVHEDCQYNSVHEDCQYNSVHEASDEGACCLRVFPNLHACCLRWDGNCSQASVEQVTPLVTGRYHSPGNTRLSTTAAKSMKRSCIPNMDGVCLEIEWERPHFLDFRSSR